MLIKGDARHIPLKDKTVQCCVTSPPYWGQLRDYKDTRQIGLEITIKKYVQQMLIVAREVRRVLCEDGTFWIVIGDVYASAWPSPRNRKNLIGQRMGGGKRSESRPQRGMADGLKEKDLCGIPWRVAFALQENGWFLRSEIIWEKPDCMTESVKDRPTRSHENVFLFSKSQDYYYDAAAISEDSDPKNFRHSRSTRRNVPPGCRTDSGFKNGREYESRNKRSVWRISRAGSTSNREHPATFPPGLVEPCILAGSRPGDIVCDVFVGSGTTVFVAQQLGRIGIGIDLTYQELAAERVAGPLFAPVVNSAFN
jgi:DNA modification methylase